MCALEDSVPPSPITAREYDAHKTLACLLAGLTQSGDKNIYQLHTTSAIRRQMAKILIYFSNHAFDRIDIRCKKNSALNSKKTIAVSPPVYTFAVQHVCHYWQPLEDGGLAEPRLDIDCYSFAATEECLDAFRSLWKQIPYLCLVYFNFKNFKKSC